jgi:hypothetical protein
VIKILNFQTGDHFSCRSFASLAKSSLDLNMLYLSYYLFPHPFLFSLYFSILSTLFKIHWIIFIKRMILYKKVFFFPPMLLAPTGCQLPSDFGNEQLTNEFVGS